MKTIRLALLSFATVISSLVATAQQAPAEAFVASMSGSATVTAPGSTTAVPLVIGQTLPEGSTVTTAEGGSVLIQSHKGMETGLGSKATAVIGSHSVSADGVRTAVIDLKEGTVVSVLDPSKRATNNYAVRTAKGVAAARGTVYTTTVTLSSGGQVTVTVNTLTGAVSFAIAGGQTVSVAAGNSANSNSTASTPISTALAGANAAEKAELVEAFKLATTVVTIIAVNDQTSDQTNRTALKGTIDTVIADFRAGGDTALVSSLLAGFAAGISAGQSATVVTSPDGTVQSISAPAPTTGSTPAQTIDITIVSPSSTP